MESFHHSSSCLSLFKFGDQAPPRFLFLLSAFPSWPDKCVVEHQSFAWSAEQPPRYQNAPLTPVKLHPDTDISFQARRWCTAGDRRSRSESAQSPFYARAELFIRQNFNMEQFADLRTTAGSEVIHREEQRSEWSYLGQVTQTVRHKSVASATIGWESL